MIDVLSQFCKCVERASIDEAYLDLTEEVEERLNSLGENFTRPDQLANTHVVGFTSKDKEQDNQDDGEPKKGKQSFCGVHEQALRQNLETGCPKTPTVKFLGILFF